MYGRKLRKSLAISLSFSLALVPLSPGMAFACEGGGELDTESSEKQEFLGGHTYELPRVAGEKKTIFFNLKLEKVTFGKWAEGGDTTNWSVKEKNHCENQTFSPGTHICEVTAEVLNNTAKEISLTIPIEFKPAGDKHTYEIKFKTK